MNLEGLLTNVIFLFSCFLVFPLFPTQCFVAGPLRSPRPAIRLLSRTSGDDKKMRKLIVLTASALLMSACSSATTATGDSPTQKRSTITTEEIQKISNPGWSAYDLISRVRPEWLRARNPQTLREPDPIYPIIYLDDIENGEIESLKDITISRVASVQYITAYDTTARFGKTYVGGAIMVRTH
jgi:hypothetical protein